ncbi:hypothetical protein MKW92_007421, partial [Papaver armeniacum]
MIGSGGDLNWSSSVRLGGYGGDIGVQDGITGSCGSGGSIGFAELIVMWTGIA